MTRTVGRTGFQIIRDWMKDFFSGEQALKQQTEVRREREAQVPELTVFNPLKTKRGDYVEIEAEEVRGWHFVVYEVDAFTCNLGGKKYFFTDCILREGDDWLTIRMLSKNDPDPHDTSPDKVLLLKLQNEIGYQDAEGLRTGLSQGIIESGEGDQIIAKYHRIGKSNKPYNAQVRVFNNDGSEQMEGSKYWDFFRKLDNGLEEYLIVDQDDDGIYKIYVAVEVPAENISVY